MPIPKIIHQIWLGPKQCPSKLMDTFRNKHPKPEFEYILWTEEEIVRRGFQLENQTAYDEMTEWCGKADILRWEILYHYGGIYQDADSICLEPFDDFLFCKDAFVAYENEVSRKELLAVGTMGFPAGHPLCRAAIDWIATHDTCPRTSGLEPWLTTGPVLLTRLYESGQFPDIFVLPSFCFIPHHFTGVKYSGHKKVYCHQVWGTTMTGYDKMNDTMVPVELLEPPPKWWVSVLVSSYNTKLLYIRDCLESIRCQEGHFGIELVWVNDGSDELYSSLLETELERFRLLSRFVRVIYHRNRENLGIGASLNLGVELCGCELVVKMDSDDIMVADRIIKQMRFMAMRPRCMMAGANLVSFSIKSEDDPKAVEFLKDTVHPEVVTAEWVKANKSRWFMNHPTVIFRRSAVLEVGNYDVTRRTYMEDYDLELRILARFGAGSLMNMPDILVHYRIHEGQVTYVEGSVM